MNKGKLKYNIINIMDRSQAKQIVFVLWKQFCFINYGHHAYFRKYIYIIFRHYAKMQKQQ